MNLPFSVVEAAGDFFRSNCRFLLLVHVVFDHLVLAVMRYQQGRMASFVFISVKTQTTEKIRFNVNLVSKTTDRLLVYRRKILPIFDKRNQSLVFYLCSTSIFML